MARIHQAPETDGPGELATLIVHEIAHAIAKHQREELSQVFYLNSAKVPIPVQTAMARLDRSWSLQFDCQTSR